MDLFEQLAALRREGHAFALATVVFYGLNNLTLDSPDDDAFELVMAVARSEPPVEDIAAALGTWH